MQDYPAPASKTLWVWTVDDSSDYILNDILFSKTIDPARMLRAVEVMRQHMILDDLSNV